MSRGISFFVMWMFLVGSIFLLERRVSFCPFCYVQILNWGLTSFFTRRSYVLLDKKCIQTSVLKEMEILG